VKAHLAIFGLLSMGLSACSGGALLGDQPGRAKVQIDEDVFFISVTGNLARVQNFATGLDNQRRLYENAQRAITTLTGCEIDSFRQQIGVNAYTAQLDCPPNITG